jgi:hypothetical protein
MVDFIGAGAAFALFSPTTVLPAFVRQLTDSAPVIGLVGTVFTGLWMLPQLATGQLIKAKPRKKPYIFVAMGGRITLAWMAVAAWMGLPGRPTAMLVVFFISLGLFAITDGIGTVPWLDIMARTIPLKDRGRMIGMAQSLSGLAGIGMGAVVGLILESRAFPDNYALLFTLAFAGQIPSTIALSLLHEPVPDERGRQSGNGGASSWLQPLLTDPAFRRLLICRILFAMGGLATPFFVVHAADVLHLPEGTIGRFVMVQALAGVVSSAGLGLISRRWGPRYVIRIGIAALATGPLYALAAHLSGVDRLAQGYPFVFASLGVLNSTVMVGFLNYLVEVAPEGMRPAYIGLGNTIAGIMALVPAAGGWLLEITSYTVLFALTALIVTGGFLYSLTLKPARAPDEG